MQASQSITGVILAGGQGRRLHPLTVDRSKPAVPIAGKFRLIDIPVSNCLHSGIRSMWVVTQFASESLHRHIHNSFQLDAYSRGFISILAASQTEVNKGWYQGTADAVRKNLLFFQDANEHILILSGDHLYRMDYQKFFDFHIENDADISLSVVPVEREKVNELGILKTASDFRVQDFVEKPHEDTIIDDFAVPEKLRKATDMGYTFSEKQTHVGSMGIYLFKKKTLFEILKRFDYEDFGKQIIPAAIPNYRVFAYPFSGYWEDIGTIRAFFEAHMDLTKQVPEFNFYDEDAPIFTRPRFLPAAKIASSEITESIISEGAIIGQDTKVSHAVVGVRGVIETGSTLENVIHMGSDYYEMKANGNVPIGVGKNCVVKNAILDKNVRIGDNSQLINKENVQNGEFGGIIIRDGLIIVPKNGIVEPGTVL